MCEHSEILFDCEWFPLELFSFQKGIETRGYFVSLFVCHLQGNLSRVLKKISEINRFMFHPKCASMMLTHLCFADDILLCCKGKFHYVHMMLKGFKSFSKTSGLQANIQKSAVNCAGMNELNVQRIPSSSGFVRENLPFKYLAIPIFSRRIVKLFNVKA